MGMYDTVICDYPLEGNPVVKEWQTKSMADPYLETYRITEDGRLQMEKYDIEDRSGPDGFIGCMTRVNQRWEDVPDYRGCIEFYGDDGDGTWWDVSALFDGGKLLNVKVTKSVEEK